MDADLRQPELRGQARGITKGSGNLLYVVGNTPGANYFANVLILAYDATTGALLNTIQYSSGSGIRSLAPRS